MKLNFQKWAASGVGFLTGLLITTASQAQTNEHKDVDAGDFSAMLSYDSTTGKYGSPNQSTDHTTTVTFGYDTDDYSFEILLPYLNHTGPEGVLRKRANLPTKIVQRLVTEAGQGDVEMSVTRSVLDEDEVWLNLDLKGTIKLPTASQSNGLGSGKADYALELDVDKTFGDFNLAGTLGYSILGSPGLIKVHGVSQNVEFKNVYSASLDGSYKFSKLLKIGLSVNTEQASTAGVIDPRSAKLYASFKPGKSVRLQIYGLKGLSDGSPESGFGASASLDF